MKKFLMTVLGIGFVASATDTIGALAAPMVERSDNGAYPSSVALDSRGDVRILQEALVKSRKGVGAVLALAESEGFGNSTGGYTEALLDQLNEGSFAGLANNTDGLSRNTLAVDTTTGAITFMFDPREIRDGVKLGIFTVTYTPVFAGVATEEADTTGQQIVGWTCTTTVSTETHLGRNYIANANGTVDAVMDGLGWPYSGCAVAGGAEELAPDVGN